MCSKESTYRALGEYAGAAQPGKHEPNWLGMEAARAKLYAESDPVWGDVLPSHAASSIETRDQWHPLWGLGSGWELINLCLNGGDQ